MRKTALFLALLPFLSGPAWGEAPGIDTAGGAALPIGAGGNTTMWVLPSGNVGIGTASPSYLLDVNGNARVGVGSAILAGSTTKEGLYFRRPDAWGTQGILFGTDATFTATNYWENLQIYNQGGGSNIVFVNGGISPTEKMRIDGNGNVGIGTMSPTQRLDLYTGWGEMGGLIINSDRLGTEANRYFTVTSYEQDGVIRINPGPDSTIFVNREVGDAATTRDFHIWNGFRTDVFTVLGASGNVGIGTDSPQATLDVRGKVNIGSIVQLAPDSTSPCSTSTNTGAIRWNGSRFEGCNGTQWRPVSGAVVIETTINEVNNGGGSPCHNGAGGAESSKMLGWALSCASRFCRQHGYTTGFATEWDGSSLESTAIVACF